MRSQPSLTSTWPTTQTSPRRAQFIPLNDEQSTTLDSELSDFQSAIGAS